MADADYESSTARRFTSVRRFVAPERLRISCLTGATARAASTTILDERQGANQTLKGDIKAIIISISTYYYYCYYYYYCHYLMLRLHWAVCSLIAIIFSEIREGEKKREGEKERKYILPATRMLLESFLKASVPNNFCRLYTCKRKFCFVSILLWKCHNSISQLNYRLDKF